jgi:hypothetical protein
MGNFTKHSGNSFYADTKYRNALQEFVDILRDLIDKNKGMKSNFDELNAEVVKIANVTHFIEHLDELDVMVG